MNMKVNKYILGLAAVVLTGFSACNTDVESAIYNSNQEHVSFDGSAASVSVKNTETTATIPVTVNRGVIANASTYTFTAEASEDGIFSNDANGTITFAAGQNTATFNVKAINLEKEKSYTYTLTLSDAAKQTADNITNVKQNTVFTIKVTRDGDWTAWEEWNTEKTATFKYSGAFLGGDDPGLPFAYRQSLTNPDKYQFKLEHWCFNVTLLLDYDKTTGVVSCAPQPAGYSFSVGDAYVTDLVNYCGIAGQSVAPSYYGSFDEKQGIISIPLAYYIPDYNNYLYGSGPEFVYIDGFVRADYSTSVAYFGRLTDASNNEFLLATIAFGDDVEYVRYALVAEDEVDATIESLSAGGGSVLKEAGQVQIPVAQSGTYYLVVVAFAGEKVVGYDATALKFTASGDAAETWTALYVGTYEYTVTDHTAGGDSDPMGGWEPAGTKIDAVLYRSNSDPTRFKIAPWANTTGDDGLIFTMSAENVITVDQVYTGYTDTTYGDVFATDMVTAGNADTYKSYLSAGIFYFNLKYHDAESAWCYVLDTFTITGDANSASARMAMSNSNRSLRAAKRTATHHGEAIKCIRPALKLKTSRR